MTSEETKRLETWLDNSIRELRAVIASGKTVSGGGGIEVDGLTVHLRFEVESLATQTASAD